MKNLTVKSIANKDAGRGIAAISPDVFEAMDIRKDEHVLIKAGDTVTAARAFNGYGKDEGNEVIRVDGQIRDEIGVNIDDAVAVEPADLETAREVSVAIPDSVDVKNDIAENIKDELAGRPLQAGEQVAINLGIGHLVGNESGKLTLDIVETRPDGMVTVSDVTRVKIVDEPSGDSGRDEAKIEETQSNSDAGDSTDSDDLSVTYEDIGGLDEEVERVREMVEMPMQYPEVFRRLGIEAPKGVLLHGPPGTGKTMLAKAVANEVDATFLSVSGPEIMTDTFAGSEERLRELFEEAQEESPAIIFMDEVDSIAPKREDANHEAQQRVVAQLLSLMDGLEDRSEIVVMGATNRPDQIDNALRRGGRFDREIEIGAPDKDGRREVLDIHTRGMPLTDDVDLDTYAEHTHGFVGADLQTLAKEAGMHALRRIRPEIDLEKDTIDAELLNNLSVRDDDFKQAMQEVEPSAMREVFVEVPDVSWDDVGGLEDTKEQLREMVQWPLEYDFLFDRADVNGSNGVLMYGPPGTGKTMLAKAVANESQANFISIEGPEIMSKYVGEAEERVREVFEKARSNAPAVVFFDEIDAIAGERDGEGSNDVTERVVSQLLTELDGLEALENVVVIATTNRPKLIDDALKRPGRFDKHVHVSVPDETARRKIFDVHTRDKPTTDSVNPEKLARQADGYVGADIEAVCEEAAMIAMRDFVRNTPEAELEERSEEMFINSDHFEQALEEVNPSVDEEQKERYREFEQG